MRPYLRILVQRFPGSAWIETDRVPLQERGRGKFVDMPAGFQPSDGAYGLIAWLESAFDLQGEENAAGIIQSLVVEALLNRVSSAPAMTYLGDYVIMGELVWE